MLDYIVMQMRKVNREKGYCFFSISPLVYRKKFTDDYYPSGYFPRTGTMGWQRLSGYEHYPVRIGKNCARGLEYGPRPQASGRTQDQGHSFSQYGPTKDGK